VLLDLFSSGLRAAPSPLEDLAEEKEDSSSSLRLSEVDMCGGKTGEPGPDHHQVVLLAGFDEFGGQGDPSAQSMSQARRVRVLSQDTAAEGRVRLAATLVESRSARNHRHPLEEVPAGDGAIHSQKSIEFDRRHDQGGILWQPLAPVLTSDCR